MSQDQGGSPTSGGTAAGGSANAGASGASEGGAPASGGSAGAAEGGAPEAGTAGEAPSAGTGGEPGDPTACSASYDGPLAGPRADGPDPVMETCDSLSDDVIRARYDDPDAKVPKGLFWEPPGLMVTWEDPCSEAPDETLGRFMDAGLGTLNGQFSTDWFFETSYCNGDSRWFYRNLRCDYYDGTLSVAGQASVNHQNLAFLASLLWYQNFSNLGGSAIIGYATSSGASEESIELCTVRTVFGDFGLCDEIALDSTVYRLDTAGDGTVTIEGPVNLRSIQGTCH